MSETEESAGEEQLDDESKRRAQERAEEIDRMYEPGARPTAVVPGTNGMVSGTAFADMAEGEPGDEVSGDADPSGEGSPD
ncbi:hypothetical protein [Rhodococcus sp. NPDC047139]|uniref:hypothetical protein n=1 Tax=Rhodococcus sp. NPDC047139 TaxID=3155141 RepID=UPI0033F35827